MAHSFITCTCCGKHEDLEPYRLINTALVTKMRAEQLCFDCAYWKTWLTEPHPEVMIISGGVYLQNEPLEVIDLYEARAKGLQFLLKVGTAKAYATKKLHLIGKIPANFRPLIPDQYRLITHDEYRRIYNFGNDKCLLKGCFDRYHCIWYRADIAEPIEPWNTIPKNYVIGSEDCPSFVNKYDNLPDNL